MIWKKRCSTLTDEEKKRHFLLEVCLGFCMERWARWNETSAEDEVRPELIMLPL